MRMRICPAPEREQLLPQAWPPGRKHVKLEALDERALTGQVLVAAAAALVAA